MASSSCKLNMTASLCVLAALLLAACGVSAQSKDFSLLDPKNAQNGCYPTKYNSIMQRLYANDTACQDLITRALNTTVPSQCPEKAPIEPGSKTHFCMNKNNSQPYLDAWTDFVKSCEILYVNQRTGDGESGEEGVKTTDNTCFPLFTSLGDFQTWLGNAVPYGGTQRTVSAATALKPFLAGLAAALALILSLVMA